MVRSIHGVCMKTPWTSHLDFQYRNKIQYETLRIICFHMRDIFHTNAENQGDDIHRFGAHSHFCLKAHIIRQPNSDFSSSQIDCHILAVTASLKAHNYSTVYQEKTLSMGIH